MSPWESLSPLAQLRADTGMFPSCTVLHVIALAAGLWPPGAVAVHCPRGRPFPSVLEPHTATDRSITFPGAATVSARVSCRVRSPPTGHYPFLNCRVSSAMSTFQQTEVNSSVLTERVGVQPVSFRGCCQPCTPERVPKCPHVSYLLESLRFPQRPNLGIGWKAMVPFHPA